ncbi:hypothetical protein J6590_080807 [Homalodisca vitripennis]|nr:hypothetical protein J6590_089116 [Homalodisca vitripennis]KAG8329705.1 hypothetical protein J6590_080807 [Homalodisca vitripennis]
MCSNTRLRLAGGYAPRPPFKCWPKSGISGIRAKFLNTTSWEKSSRVPHITTCELLALKPPS